MSYRPLNGKASLLRIYVSDFDKYQHHELYRYIVQQAREAGLAGCTVFRGFWGYGVREFIHTDIAVETAGERPILIEITDSANRVAEFAKKAAPWLEKAGGLITEETVHVHHYQHSTQTGLGEPTKILQTEEHMTARSLNGENVLLRIFIDETDKYDSKPLFEAMMERCKDLGIAGCTAIQGIMGFGASSVIHKGHLFRLSQDLPMVIEVVDTSERVQKLLEQIRPMLQGALVTEEKVRVHHYAPRSEG